MYPTLLSIGIFDFHAYTVMVALAFLVGTIMTVNDNYKLPRPYNITPSGGIWVFVGALFGAKLYWHIQYGDLTKIYEAFYLWQGGLVFYGGLFGGIAGALLYLRSVKAPVVPIADIALSWLPLSHAIAREGCFLNGCCWGRVAPNLPWAVEYPRGTSPFYSQVKAGLLDVGAQHSLPVHPTQVYESLGLLVIFFIMRYCYKRRLVTGATAIMYPFLYGILRFTVEHFRGDSAHPLFNLTVSQYVAMSFTLGAALVFVYMKSGPWRGRQLFGRKGEFEEQVEAELAEASVLDPGPVGAASEG